MEIVLLRIKLHKGVVLNWGCDCRVLSVDIIEKSLLKVLEMYIFNKLIRFCCYPKQRKKTRNVCHFYHSKQVWGCWLFSNTFNLGISKFISQNTAHPFYSCPATKMPTDHPDNHLESSHSLLLAFFLFIQKMYNKHFLFKIFLFLITVNTWYYISFRCTA